MGVGLQLCLIDGGDSLQLDLLPAASAREGMERRALRGGGGGGDTEIYCVISQRGGSPSEGVGQKSGVKIGWPHVKRGTKVPRTPPMGAFGPRATLMQWLRRGALVRTP